jgi:hypothetical protein
VSVEYVEYEEAGESAEVFMLEGENVFVLVPLAFITAFLLGIVVREVRKYATQRHELEVKRDMVERGLSVEEIERVIAAKTPGDK